jgi:hypothetical protein
MSDPITQKDSSAVEAPTTSGDLLAVIDEIETSEIAVEQHEIEEDERIASMRSEFSTEFTSHFESEARPAMEAIIERLRSDGGGGVILESDLFDHRFTLWMSLSGEIEGTPSTSRYPYLQLDAEVKENRVRVSEGDSWRGRPGASSGKVTDWTLEEMDAAHIDREVVEILRRSTAGRVGPT